MQNVVGIQPNTKQNLYNMSTCLSLVKTETAARYRYTETGAQGTIVH